MMPLQSFRLRRSFLVLGLVPGLMMAMALLASCSQRGGEALALLDSFSGSQRADSPVITRESGRLDSEQGDFEVDVYKRADEQVRANLLLIPGVTPQGRDDPRLMEFAELLAQARFRVTVPELPNLRELKVSAEDIASIDSLLMRLSKQASAESRPLGLVAISYAAGPALIAASQAEPENRPDFMLAIGGYYSTENVVRYFTTGAFRTPEDQDWQEGRPHPQARWLFLRANADRLDNTGDVLALRRLAARKLQGPNAGNAAVHSQLTAQGRAVLALLENDDPERVEEGIDALPESLRAELSALNLADRPLDAVDFPVLLLHGRDDPVIPYSESLRLAEALPEGMAEVTLTEGLMHVDMSDSRISDGLRLYDLTVRLLELRDAVE
ncbi:alpha/beta hydrolase [Fodinicurvata fenggangensis]|uniref:alpha/beta hydrolase n=1 Tax=Fodinicurvata fenggangensis TaxID=1121830 RepID=UPI00069011F3|nr:alpha/beta hydrolase [Fodinicurvata fenggangensis]